MKTKTNAIYNYFLNNKQLNLFFMLENIAYKINIFYFNF